MTTYYVATTGSTGNDGLSVSTAKKTIAGGLAKLQNGDTLIIKGGTYAEYGLELTKNNCTVQAAAGETVTINAGRTYSGFAKVPVVYTRTLLIRGNGNTVDRLRCINNIGGGIWIGGDNNTVKNCTVEWAAIHGIQSQGDLGTLRNGNIIEYCVVRFTNLSQTGGSIEQRFSQNGIIRYCTVERTFGEMINNHGSNDCSIIGNTTINPWLKPSIYIDSAYDILVDGNLCITTKDLYPDTYTANGGNGIKLTNEWYGSLDYETKNITITNNLVVNCYRGVEARVTTGPEEFPNDAAKLMGFKNIRIINNTFVNSRFNSLLIVDDPRNLPDSHTACYLENNIFLHESSNNGVAEIFRTNRAAAVAKWNVNNNIFSAAPTYNSINLLTAAAAAANNLTSTTAADLLVDYDAATGSPGAFDIDNYKLPSSGSDALDAGLNTRAPDEDYFGGTRPYNTTVDVGFHEYGTSETGNSLTPDWTISDATPVTGQVITFGDDTTENGNATQASAVLWAFSDGEYVVGDATSASPQVKWDTAGQYTISYTVYDTIGQPYTKTDTIVVTAEDGGSQLERALVEANAGDTSIAHGLGIAPSIVIVAASKATADANIGTGANIIPNLEVSYGAYANGVQYAASVYASSNTDLEDADHVSGDESDCVVYLRGSDIKGRITGIDGTNVSMEWFGTTGDEVISLLCLGGSAIEAPRVRNFLWDRANGIKTQTSEANVIIALTTAQEMNLGWFNAVMNMGFAVKNSGQGCLSTFWARNGGTAQAMFSDRIGWRAYQNWVFDASFGNGQYTIEASNLGTGADAALSVLEFKLTGLTAGILFGDTPTDTSPVSYSTTIDPGLLIGALTNITATGSQVSGNSAGFLGLYMTDGTAERSTGGYHTPNADPSAAGTMTDGDYSRLDHAGDGLATGGIALSTGDFDATMTTADSTARKMLMFYIEDGDSAALTASFYYEAPQTETLPDGTVAQVVYAGDDVDFFNNSQADGTYAITGYDWDFGDGVGSSSSEDPTYSWSTPGTYTVTFEVTDANSATSEISVPIVVLPARPTVSFALDPAVFGGSTPYEFEITPSFAAGSGSTLDNGYYIIERLFVNAQGEDDRIPIKGSSDLSSAMDVTLTDSGEYVISWTVYYETGEGFGGVVTLGDIDDGEITNAITISADVSSGRMFVGPKEITFAILLNGEAVTADSFDGDPDWDFGDTNTSTDLAPTNEYAAVSSATWYDVSVDVTLPGGEELSAESDNFVRIVPEPDDPPTFQNQYARIAALELRIATVMSELGYIAGDVWAQEASPNINVFKVDLNAPIADGQTVVVFEDGVALTSRASIALCHANAGSYYTSFTGSTLSVYVHTSNGDNPGLNQKLYRWDIS